MKQLLEAKEDFKNIHNTGMVNTGPEGSASVVSDINILNQMINKRFAYP